MLSHEPSATEAAPFRLFSLPFSSKFRRLLRGRSVRGGLRLPYELDFKSLEIPGLAGNRGSIERETITREEF